MAATKHKSLKVDIVTLLCLFFVLFTSYFTFFHNFWNPSAFYWDENYHVSAAQKYLNGVFFMEPHPPLGKMIVASGESFLDLSTNDSQFIDTDYAKGDFSDGFSIIGYRFFPALLGWLTAPVFFLIFFILSGSPVMAALLSFLYIFDNAFIVHSRGAMLDSILIFFIANTILFFVALLKQNHSHRDISILSLFFGASFACAANIKLTGLIVALLIPVALWTLRRDKEQLMRFCFYSVIGFLVIFLSVWQLHFSRTIQVNPELNNKGWYQASDEYKEIVTKGKQWNPLSFPRMLYENMHFSGHYEKGVPRLDLCKPDENGSPFYLWPFGARSISYRWATPGDGTFRYLYLVANPAAWGMGLLGVILTVSLLLTSLFFPMRTKLKNPLLLLTFLGMYAAYMIVMSRIDRVMYLYHYFPPLLFSFILFCLITQEMRRFGKWKLNEEHKIIGVMGLMLLVFLAFQFYRPLTYYVPLTNEQFEKRAILRTWNLRCAHCDRDDPIVVPRECKKK